MTTLIFSALPFAVAIVGFVAAWTCVLVLAANWWADR